MVGDPSPTHGHGGLHPRLRGDLQATPHQEGPVAVVDVVDPHTDRRFRFYDFEYRAACSLDGRPLEAVVAELRSREGADLGLAQLAAFCQQLDALGFLERSAGRDADGAGWRGSWSRRRHHRLLAYAAGAGLTALVLAGLALRLLTAPRPAVVAVHVARFPPGTVYHWFEPVGMVRPASPQVLTFPAGGRVTAVVPPGTHLVTGERLALLDGARLYLAEEAHLRERLAYYEQMGETMRAADNRPEARQAELHAQEKRQRLAEVRAGVAAAAVVAPHDGEVQHAFAALGDRVVSRGQAFRLVPRGWEATFPLSREEASIARRLGFCRVEVDRVPFTCTPLAEGDEGLQVALDVPEGKGVTPGQPARLARSRYDAVFTLPAGAVQTVGQTDRIYVVAGEDRAEARLVVLAERSAREVVVLQGLDVGDRIVVDPPPQLRAGMAVATTPASP